MVFLWLAEVELESIGQTQEPIVRWDRAGLPAS